MNETLTNRQIAFIVIGALVGDEFIILSHELAQGAGTGGWFTIVLSSIIVAISAYIFAYLGNTHKNQTLYDYSRMLVGKYITYIFAFIYIFYFLIFSSISSRLFCEDIKIFILPRTPISALYLLLLFAIFLVVDRKLRVLARLCEFYMSIVIIGIVIVLTIVITQGEFVNLRPFWNSEDFLSYIKASHYMIAPFLGFELLGCIAFNKDNKGSWKYAILAVFVVSALYIYTFETCVSVLGVDDVIHYKLVFLNTLRSVDVPYLDFLKRLDGIAMIFWFMSMFCYLSLFVYGTVFYIKKALSKIPYRIILLSVLGLSAVVFSIPKSYEEAYGILNAISYLIIFTALIIPCTLLILTKVKKNEKNTR